MAVEEATAHRRAADAFAQRVRAEHEDEVEEVHLFGSVATGDARPTSDVDLLVVVAAGESYPDIDDQLLDIAYEVGIEHGVRLEVHSIPADEFAARKARGEPFVSSALAAGDSRV